MSVPFDQLPGMIWFDGKLVPGPEAKIHVLTHGLHYASAVFEGERAYGGEIFKSTRAFRAAEEVGAIFSISKFRIRSPRSTRPSSL